jgi:ATP-binding cassette subfamily B protein
MDCGPAALKCLLQGFGIRASYGRLREACQTDVDGTSIDTLEAVANQLGLEADQVLVPADHVLLPEAAVLPSIAVVRRSNGITHFVVAWRVHGGVVQLMDPETGRRWTPRGAFLDELYQHETPVGAAEWREWAGSEEFLLPLRARLARLGLPGREIERHVAAAGSDAGWRGLATLDAATRMVASVAGSGALRGRAGAAEVLRVLLGGDGAAAIPEGLWSARAAPPGPAGEERLTIRGAVLVHVRGRRAGARREAGPIAPGLARALDERPDRPGRELLRLLRADGLLAPLSVAGALAVAAGAGVLEALLFRALFDLGRELPLVEHRLGALGALLGFAALLLLLDLPLAGAVLGLGRRLELRLRMAILGKIARVGDRWFQSRLVSDLAERCHSLHELRQAPEVAGLLLRSTFELVLTTAGIVWLDPRSAPLALLAAATALGLPLLAQPVLAERDLRLRSHTGALGRFYLDALLGLVPVRAHGAERALRREQESLLVRWAEAGLRVQRAVVSLEALQAVLGLGLAGWLLLAHLDRGGGTLLLLAWWALQLPWLGQEITLAARQYPALRSVTLRLLEPLGAEEEPSGGTAPPAQASSRGASLRLSGVSVRAAGRTVLEEIDLAVEPGSHVAIVGPSGAGKSTLLGVLLGWHLPATGEALVDGLPLSNGRLEGLRRETAWVEPSVHLWNRPLIDNLRYGTVNGGARPLGEVLRDAGLRTLLEQLPDGLVTSLGEGGALISGGEGQRVRLGRALHRPGVRLAILDEPFRGLDRERRRELLRRLRERWREATLLCATHDVAETKGFDRVLVVENGRIIEDGPPEALAGRASRYRALLDAEEAVRRGLWSGGFSRRLRLEHSRLEEVAP